MDILRKSDHSIDMSSPRPYAQELIDALQRREEVIANHAWRDSDAAAHLDTLKAVSEKIAELGKAWKTDGDHPLPPRLRHFLEGCSYQKALAFLQDGGGACR